MFNLEYDFWESSQNDLIQFHIDFHMPQSSSGTSCFSQLSTFLMAFPLAVTLLKMNQIL